MMTLPVVMPFVRGILFSMRLVNLQETQVVCHQEHPCFEGHTMVGIILEAMAAAPQDLLWAMMMTSPLVMPFVHGVLFGMHLANLQETQVVCCQEHPCFEGHTMVGIVLEAMAAAPQDLYCAMADDDIATGDALRSGRPVQHTPGELKRDSGSM
jgi:hypothetical protein